MLYDPKWDAAQETKLEPWRQLLLDAVDHIERYGHCKRRLGQAGEATCALGACVAISPVGWLSATTRLSRAVGSVSDWNNAPERTAAEVVTKMREVARAP